MTEIQQQDRADYADYNIKCGDRGLKTRKVSGVVWCEKCGYLAAGRDAEIVPDVTTRRFFFVSFNRERVSCFRSNKAWPVIIKQHLNSRALLCTHSYLQIG